MTENNFFFIAKAFFVKVSFISALMIVVNLLFFRSMQCCFVHLRFQGICLWRISALKEERKYQRNLLSCFFFCLFFLFWMLLFLFTMDKIKPYYANKAQSFFTDFFFSQDSFVFFLKKHLALHIETWVRVCCYIRHLCLHLLFYFANLRWCYRGDIPCLTRKKSWRRLHIFLKPRSMKVRNFKLTCWYALF